MCRLRLSCYIHSNQIRLFASKSCLPQNSLRLLILLVYCTIGFTKQQGVSNKYLVIFIKINHATTEVSMLVSSKVCHVIDRISEVNADNWQKWELQSSLEYD